MARPRNKQNAWMPPHVERYKGGYRWNKKHLGTKKLCNKDATRAEVWAAYEELIVRAGNDENTVNALLDAYFNSPQYRRLKSSTQKDYSNWAVKVRDVFGGMRSDTLTSPHVQLFMDTRGEIHPTAANHEKSLISIAMNWGKARGYVSIPNPCDAVKKISVEKGGRYVEDHEYWAFYDSLTSRPMIQSAMEIAYLCAARRQDVVALTREDIKPEGLLIVQGKTNKAQLKLWTPRLREAVDKALAIKHKADSFHIIRNRSGQPYTRSGFTAVWKTTQTKAIENKILAQKFRFHDLKIKGISDYEGDKQEFSGHKTHSMVEHYNRTADKVTTIDKGRKS